MKRVVKFKDEVLCEELKIANDFSSRLIGLMFKRKMIGFDGLLIKQCNSIHTFFMKYDLDIIFLDKNMKVIKVIERMKPWRMTLMYLKASQVLELEGGRLNKKIKKNDQLEIICTN